MSGAPDMKCSMMAPRIIGLSSGQSSPVFLVTVMKSEPKKTPLTPGTSKAAARAATARLVAVAQIERAALEHGAPGEEF